MEIFWVSVFILGGIALFVVPFWYFVILPPVTSKIVTSSVKAIQFPGSNIWISLDQIRKKLPFSCRVLVVESQNIFGAMSYEFFIFSELFEQSWKVTPGFEKVDRTGHERMKAELELKTRFKEIEGKGYAK